MTVYEFNKKWKKYLRKDFYGMDIENPEVIDYLDKEFEKEVKTNSYFQYSQIKLKAGTSRVYVNSTKRTLWESQIDKIINTASNNNEISEYWWDNLLPEWQYIFLFNIEFYNYKPDNYVYDNYKLYKENAKQALGTEHIISEFQKIEDILNDISRLPELYIFENQLNLQPLSKLKQLQKLDLTNNTEDLSPISELKELKELILIGNQQNLSPIKTLNNLEFLDLLGNVEDIGPISNLINLKKIDLMLNYCDISPATSLVNLQEICLLNCKPNKEAEIILNNIVKQNTNKNE